MPPGRPRKRTRTFGAHKNAASQEVCDRIYTLDDRGDSSQAIFLLLRRTRKLSFEPSKESSSSGGMARCAAAVKKRIDGRRVNSSVKDFIRDRKEYGKVVNDGIHETIAPHPLLVCIMDTKEVQRLRGIRCLSETRYAYPSATHSWFKHSLGWVVEEERMATYFFDKETARAQRLYQP